MYASSCRKAAACLLLGASEKRYGAVWDMTAFATDKLSLVDIILFYCYTFIYGC